MVQSAAGARGAVRPWSENCNAVGDTVNVGLMRVTSEHGLFYILIADFPVRHVRQQRLCIQALLPGNNLNSKQVYIYSNNIS